MLISHTTSISNTTLHHKENQVTHLHSMCLPTIFRSQFLGLTGDLTRLRTNAQGAGMDPNSALDASGTRIKPKVRASGAYQCFPPATQHAPEPTPAGPVAESELQLLTEPQARRENASYCTSNKEDACGEVIPSARTRRGARR